MSSRSGGKQCAKRCSSTQKKKKKKPSRVVKPTLEFNVVPVDASPFEEENPFVMKTGTESVVVDDEDEDEGWGVIVIEKTGQFVLRLLSFLSYLSYSLV